MGINRQMLQWAAKLKYYMMNAPTVCSKQQIKL